MQSVSSFAFVALVVLNLGSQSLACFSTFKNAQNITFIQQDCAKSAGVATIPSAEELASEGTNDNCLSKCIMNVFQVIDTDGQIDKDVLLDYMEANAPDAYLLKLSELATTCAETSGADKLDGATKLGKSPPECKPMKDFYSCFLMGAEKLC